VTYVEVCKERCELCAKGRDIVGHKTLGRAHHISLGIWRACAAPSKSRYIVELTARLEAAEADTERVDAILAILSDSGTQGLLSTLNLVWDQTGTWEFSRELIDAARTGTKRAGA
jgi:hypothetical protein